MLVLRRKVEEAIVLDGDIRVVVLAVESERVKIGLELRRKVEEAIVLDRDIRVVVLAVEGERVKIGIEAPDAVTIVREELLRPERQEEPATAP